MQPKPSNYAFDTRPEALPPVEGFRDVRQPDPNKEPASCHCGNEYFKEVQAFKVPVNQRVNAGQKLSKIDGRVFYLYQCCRCNDIFTPQTFGLNPNSVAGQEYNQFLDQVDHDPSKTEAVEPTGVNLKDQRILDLETKLEELQALVNNAISSK